MIVGADSIPNIGVGPPQSPHESHRVKPADTEATFFPSLQNRRERLPQHFVSKPRLHRLDTDIYVYALSPRQPQREQERGMLLRSCNVADLRLQFWPVTPKPTVYLRSTGVSVSCSSSSARDVDLAVTSSGDSRPRSASRPADLLRLGKLAEDGLSYKENFIVRCYEVGINKTATVETMANLLQEVGCNHAQSVGFSTDGFATTTTMRKLHLIWVTSRMHIEIYKYPAWGDVVEIETWCQEDGRIGTRRDWILKDFATGEVIGRATSKWVMMNQDTRRLQRVSDDVREEYLVFCPRTPRLAFPEKDSSSLKKIPKLEDPAEYSRLGLVPRRADLDMNQHVNNVTYIGWVLESMPQDIMDTHELQKITLDYRRECQHNDRVDSLTSWEAGQTVSEYHGTNGSATSRKNENDFCQFLHFLRLSADGLEINRGCTEWRRKPQR